MAAPAFDTIENTQIPCLLNRKIDNGRFVLERRLGQGGYSVVYLARDLHARPGSPGPTHFAVKCVLDRRRTKTAREVTLHRRASNIPGCVKIHRTLHETGLFFVILEYCPNGDLFSMITEKKLFLGRDDLIKPVFLQLLDSVAALHRMGIYHRDLKPENVLCVMPGGQSMKVFIADFGLATECELSKSFGCGSYFYMTPECLAGSYSSAISAYSSRAADIWALGIILVNLICARSPWKVAMLSDESFARYTKNPNWLRSMLPLSMPAFRFLDRIFANHGNNVRLEDLRAQFLEIDTFYMSPAELAVADKTARLVAREWIPEAPMDDIKQEDILKMADVVDEAHLFDDSVHTGNVESESPTSDGTDILASFLISCTSTESGSSDSDFPITPESKPVHPAEGVPELPSNQKMGEQWVLSTAQVHSFHEALTVAQVGPSIENLIL